MSSQKGARSKLADVLADIKNSRAEDEYDYDHHDLAPTPKRRNTVNYVALSGHTPRQSRSSTANASSTSLSNASQEPKITPTTHSAPTPQRTRTYILKLFDRTVNLAEFTSDNTREDYPLYPICRAWVQGHQIGQTQGRSSPERQPLNGEKRINGSPNTTANQPETSATEATTEVHSLPSPKSKLEVIEHFNLTSSDNQDIDIRIPQSIRDFKAPDDVEAIIDKSIHSMTHQECMDSNKQRWKKVKRDWIEARGMHESRYTDSFKVLHEMFMSAQRGV